MAMDGATMSGVMSNSWNGSPLNGYIGSAGCAKSAVPTGLSIIRDKIGTIETDLIPTLHKMVDMLTDRLGAVLTPDTPEASVKQGVPLAGGSDVAARLSQVISGLVAVNSRLDRLMNRVEV